MSRASVVEWKWRHIGEAGFEGLWGGGIGSGISCSRSSYARCGDGLTDVDSVWPRRLTLPLWRDVWRVRNAEKRLLVLRNQCASIGFMLILAQWCHTSTADDLLSFMPCWGWSHSIRKTDIYWYTQLIFRIFMWYFNQMCPFLLYYYDKPDLMRKHNYFMRWWFVCFDLYKKTCNFEKKARRLYRKTQEWDCMNSYKLATYSLKCEIVMKRVPWQCCLKQMCQVFRNVGLLFLFMLALYLISIFKKALPLMTRSKNN